MKQPVERITCTAEVIKMSELPYEDIASTRGIPIVRPIYEVIFQCENEMISFALSEFEYAVLEVGMKGKLIYEKKKHCNEMVAFRDNTKGEIIKEFHADHC